MSSARNCWAAALPPAGGRHIPDSFLAVRALARVSFPIASAGRAAILVLSSIGDFQVRQSSSIRPITTASLASGRSSAPTKNTE